MLSRKAWSIVCLNRAELMNFSFKMLIGKLGEFRKCRFGRRKEGGKPKRFSLFPVETSCRKLTKSYCYYPRKICNNFCFCKENSFKTSSVIDREFCDRCCILNVLKSIAEHDILNISAAEINHGNMLMCAG